MKKPKVQVYPSILSGDFGRLSEEAKRIEEAGADGVHIDIMDGHFVPNLTFGAKAIAAINRSTELFLDVHAMIYNPYDFVEDFVAAGADRITFHLEATEDIGETIDFVKKCGIQVGLAVRPETSFSMIPEFAPHVDMILIMTVNPGFGGQKFMPKMLEKVKLTREHFPDVNIQVDGGINDQTGPECVKAGANILVAGEYLFSQPNMKEAIQKLR